MTRDIASQISTEFEQLGWNHQWNVVAGAHSLTLQVSEMIGDDVLKLFSVLAPNGVPIPGVTVSLNPSGLVLT